MGNRWSIKRNVCIEESGEALIRNLIESRGVEDVEEYLEPTERSFFDPFFMKDMKVAADRIKEAMLQGEKITVYGDYDVDGISASSILQLYFREIGYPVSFYVPDRRKEGYGLNREALKKIFDEGTTLVITVDCGITAIGEAEFSKELNLDLIITDHHRCSEVLPEALAVLNPHRNDCTYPYPHLCGAGIAFKLVQALSEKNAIDLKPYLEIAALATVADIVDLTGENRAIVKMGLSSINSEKNNFGIRALIEVSSLMNAEIDAYHIGYLLAPRINSSGRIGDAEFGIKLLTASSMEEAMVYAQKLNQYNKERQEIEEEIVTQAFATVERDDRYGNEDVIVVAGEGWNEGVIGIVSSRLTEKYYKPSFVISIREDGIGKGSGRSIPAFPIFDAMTEIKDVFLGFGGHSQAAGLSIEKERIGEFRLRINEVAKNLLTQQDKKREWKAECFIDKSHIDRELVRFVKKMEPFGMKNPKPLFVLQNVTLQNLKKMGKKEDHMSATIQGIRLVGFRQAELVEEYQRCEGLDLLFSLEENRYQETTCLQMQMKDYKFVGRKLSVEDCLRFISCLKQKDLRESMRELPFVGFPDIAPEHTCFITSKVQHYEELSTFLEYGDFQTSVVKFCPNIENIGIRGYNNFVICDPLSDACYASLKELEGAKIYRLEDETLSRAEDRLLNINEEEGLAFLERLKTNRKTLISRATVDSMKREKLLALLLYLTVFEECGSIRRTGTESKIRVEFIGGKSDCVRNEIRRLNNMIQKWM